EVAGQQWTVGGHLDRRRRLVNRLGLDDGRGRLPVVEEGGVGGEPLDAHELLAVEPTSGPLEADVTFPGNVPYPTVIRHGRKPYVPLSPPGPTSPRIGTRCRRNIAR